MTSSAGPLLTEATCQVLSQAHARQQPRLECSFDLERSREQVTIEPEHWLYRGRPYPYLQRCRDRTVYYWTGSAFAAVARFTQSLIKLVPTRWGAPTFEIDGIKMLPSEQLSPYEDAQRKVDLIEPRGKRILDTCGGLGYFAHWCLQREAAEVRSFEKNAEVLWLRSLNPWSPANAWNAPDARLQLHHGDALEQLPPLSAASIDAVLHDPPRFGIAGELYSQSFYEQLARVLRPHGRLFHYTGTPNKLSAGRDLAAEVMQRLRRAGFDAAVKGDGILATRRAAR